MTLLLTLLFICSGAAGLVYESLWSRYLGLLVGHGAYAQVLVLVIFLGGMALGAAATSRVPLGVVRVIVADLVAERYLAIEEQPEELPIALIERIRDRVRAL